MKSIYGLLFVGGVMVVIGLVGILAEKDYSFLVKSGIFVGVLSIVSLCTYGFFRLGILARTIIGG